VKRRRAAERIATARSSVQLDELDQSIVGLMRREPDIAGLDLARSLAVTEKTARLHLRRLYDLNVLRVVTMVNLPAVGLPFLAAAGVQVRGRSPTEVAREIAQIANVLTVNVVLGNQDLEIQIVTRTLRDLADLLTNVIAKIKGVGSIAVGVAIRVLKHEVLWVPFPTPGWQRGRSGSELSATIGDELDAKIIDCIADDSRISNRAVARALRVNEGTVRARRRRLLAQKLVRTATVMNVEQLRNPIVAYFWISVDSAAHLHSVAEALTRLPQITFVALMSGRCDVLGITLVQSSDELVTLLHRTLDRIPGIYRTQHTLSRSTFKHDSRWCVLVDRV
jgi:Lrp/AsnC family transcriptional regulator, regulator for asnA, asnC and gidA